MTGSQTRGFVPLSVALSKIRSLPFGSMLVWIGMIGKRRGGAPTGPTCAGSEPLLATVTVIGVAVVSLPAASRTVAVSTCDPLPPSVVSQLTRVRRGQILDTERCSVELELHAVHAGVVGRVRGDGDGSEDGGAVRAAQ